MRRRGEAMASRRDFVKTMAITGAGFTIVPRHVLGRGQTAAERPAQHCRRRRRRHGQDQPAQPRHARTTSSRCAMSTGISPARPGTRWRRPHARTGAAAEGDRRDGSQEQPRAHRVVEEDHRRRSAAHASAIATTAKCSTSKRTSTRSSSRRPITRTRPSRWRRWTRASTSTCRSR